MGKKKGVDEIFTRVMAKLVKLARFLHKEVLVFFVVWFVLSQCVVLNAQVPSGSMEPTIQTGDRIIGYRLSYTFAAPERFDIVVFRHADKGQVTYMVKRIVGLPGEKIEIMQGQIYINGSLLPQGTRYLAQPDIGDYGPVQIPENCYFMLGDNQRYSHDSRRWDNPFVERSSILAKALIAYYPEMRTLG